jgi:hypothetical protein
VAQLAKERSDPFLHNCWLLARAAARRTCMFGRRRSFHVQGPEDAGSRLRSVTSPTVRCIPSCRWKRCLELTVSPWRLPLVVRWPLAATGQLGWETSRPKVMGGRGREFESSPDIISVTERCMRGPCSTHEIEYKRTQLLDKNLCEEDSRR